MVYLKFEEGHASFDSACVKTPLDHILISVILCLGHEILEKQLQDFFKDVCVYFGNSCLKILCSCRKVNENDFLTVISDCYILKNLKFCVDVCFTTIDV